MIKYSFVRALEAKKTTRTKWDTLQITYLQHDFTVTCLAAGVTVKLISIHCIIVKCKTGWRVEVNIKT